MLHCLKNRKALWKSFSDAPAIAPEAIIRGYSNAARPSEKKERVSGGSLAGAERVFECAGESEAE